MTVPHEQWQCHDNAKTVVYIKRHGQFHDSYVTQQCHNNGSATTMLRQSLQLPNSLSVMVNGFWPLILPCHTLYDPPRTSARLPLYRQDDSDDFTIVKRPWGSQRDTNITCGPQAIMFIKIKDISV